MQVSRFKTASDRNARSVGHRGLRAPKLVRSSVTHQRLLAFLGIWLFLGSTGCTSVSEYIHNGCKVGPNYHQPPALVARKWIDAEDKRLKPCCDDYSQWWKVFNDPALDALICTAYHQNLTLREAGFRIMQARAQLGIARGEFFPQVQNLTGSYTRFARSAKTATANAAAVSGVGFGPRFFDQWDYAFNLNWELDFWGRFRRAIESQEDTLEATVSDFDAAIITLLGD